MAKKLLIIIGSILVFVGLAGGICAYFAGATTFLSQEEFLQTYGKGLKNVNETYKGSLSQLYVDTISATVHIQYSDSDEMKVDYTAKAPGHYCEADFDEENGVLRIYEKSNLLISMFAFAYESSELTVTLPVKYIDEEINKAEIKLTSGTLSGNLPKAEKTDLYFTSGKAEDVTIDCNKANFGITSGVLSIVNRGNRMEEVKLTATSGIIKLSDFAADNSYYDLTSGDITVTGATGNITVDKTSGSATLDISDYDGDITIDSTSGENTIKLPADAGFDMEFDCTSGSCEILMNTENSGETKTISFDEDVSTHIGGIGAYKISVDVTSGHTLITLCD